MASAFAVPARAGELRVATYNVELSRKGPGLLLRDMTRGDAKAEAVAQVVAGVAPDVIALQGVDWDHGQVTIRALRDLIGAAGQEFPYILALRPNSGMMSGLDLDGDGRLRGPGDAQGYGRFAGDGGMAILSRYPLGPARDLSGARWAGYDWAMLPMDKGALFPSEAAMEVQRLSSVGHWIVPIKMAGEAVDLLVFHASPPVFDGPEDRNGKRNHDEIMLWRHVLDAEPALAEGRFVILGDFNLDPVDGEGLKQAVRGMLEDRRLRDPTPRSAGAVAAQDAGHRGDPALDTVDWPAVTDGGPGNLRVSYILPSKALEVGKAGVFWPAPGASGHELAMRASRHRLVWADVRW
ncbi:endonuclease/exonuclease/phosphatase family protein [Rhodalgimonas zhirmunskyi]|nr:endonuclease/exonuclease/phosphatase family protein [Rhodoalgimonas zhirmunskyi]